MLVLALVGVLALNIGLVQNSPCLSKITNYASSMKESAMEKASSSFSQAEKYNRDSTYGLSEFARQQQMSESSYSSRSYEASHSSSSSSGDISWFEDAIRKCSSWDIDTAIFLKYLKDGRCSKSIAFFKDLMGYINVTDRILYENDINFVTFKEEMYKIYKLLTEANIYSSDSDWFSQTDVYEKAKIHLSKALGYLQTSCILYKPWKQCLENDLSMLPLLYALNEVILENQSTYFPSNSSGVRSISSSTTFQQPFTSTGSSMSSSSGDISWFEDAIRKCSSWDIDTAIFLKYLKDSRCSKSIAYFRDLFDYINVTDQILYEKDINFAKFKEELDKVYKLLAEANIYSCDSDWFSQTDVYEKAKIHLSKALGYLETSCILYKPWKQCLENDLSMLPLLSKLTKMICEGQASYLSSSSSSSSYSAATQSFQQSCSEASSTAGSASNVVVNACCC